MYRWRARKALLCYNSVLDCYNMPELVTHIPMAMDSFENRKNGEYDERDNLPGVKDSCIVARAFSPVVSFIRRHKNITVFAPDWPGDTRLSSSSKPLLSVDRGKRLHERQPALGTPPPSTSMLSHLRTVFVKRTLAEVFHGNETRDLVPAY
jgi:hypothetical protein